MNDTNQDMMDELYKLITKDGAEEGVPVPWDYPMRMFDRATIRNLLGNQKWEWPRLRDLPEKESEEFKMWLMGNGLTVPLLDMVLAEDQDAYYPHDYGDWKNGREACFK